MTNYEKWLCEQTVDEFLNSIQTTSCASCVISNSCPEKENIKFMDEDWDPDVCRELLRKWANKIAEQ